MNDISPLFPEITPFATHMLEVGDGHTLYVEQSGNLAGVPVIVLHGGPGSGSKPKHRQFFNPALYHIIAFDQRGSGQSQPSGSVKANTTEHLVADIETIRHHLHIEKWVVYGNSWGSTLALAYAQTHTRQVLGLVIGAIFTGTEKELEWLYSPAGLDRFFPNEYQALMEVLGHPSASEIKSAIYQAVMQDNDYAMQVARATSLLDAVSMDLVPNVEEIRQHLNGPEFTLTPVRIWAHYFANTCFLTPNQLLNDAPLIAHLPIYMTQAGLDLCCPPETAINFHKALPQSELTLVHLCGHRANETMETARIAATNAMAHRLSQK